MGVGIPGVLLISVDGGLIGKLRSIQCLPPLGNLLKKRFPLSLLFGKLVLYLGTKILIGLELVLVFRRGNLFFNVFDLGQQRGVGAGCLWSELAFKLLPAVL